MDDKAKDELLHKIYYVEKRQVGRDNLFQYVSKQLEIKDVARQYIANWLAKQKGQQIYTQRKKPTNIRPIITSKPGAMVAVDLIDFSNSPSKGGYNYILNFIDTFSRKCYLTPLRNKTSASIDKALEKNILEFTKYYTISVIISDNGTEFNGSIFSKFNIKHITTPAYTPQGNSICERSNGTLKSILRKILYNEKKKDWRPFISVIENIYNTTYNRNIHNTPNEAFNSTDEQQLEQNIKEKNRHAKAYKEIDILLKIGDSVRILIPKKTKIEKGKPTYTDEVYNISKVIPGNAKTFTIPRYKLIDSNNVIQKHTFPISKLLVLPDDYVE